MSAFSPDPAAASLADDFTGLTAGSATKTLDPAAAEQPPPIRLISLSSLKAQPPSVGFPRCPDDIRMCVTLESIDRSISTVFFVSHCWLRGYPGAEGWNGKPHPDNAQHEKFKLTVEGVEKAWRTLAPGMTECYLWIDFSCMNQDGDPCGELKQLDKIIRACDCVFTPIVDHDWRQWGADLRVFHNKFEDYRAPLWRDGQYAYVNRAWCRMEMLYAANLDLHDDVELRRDKFTAGLRSAAERNFRPQLLYGTRESQIGGGIGFPPLMLPPLQNSFASTHSPIEGSITKESDKPKIEELMAQLRIRRVVEGYEGDRNALGQMHGQGTFRYASGDVYEGQWENDMRHGQCIYRYADGDVYEGHYENGLYHGQGTYRYASGEVYVGQYENGQYHGQGTYRYANGNVYVGLWVHGQRHGQGKYTFASGAVFEGQYENGKYHGQGTFRYANGNVYVGQWESGKRHGQGEITSASGVVLEVGRWERGTFVN